MVSSQQARPILIGALLMGLGGLFLIAQLLGGNFWSYFWPYPIMALGLIFLVAMVTNGRGSGALAIPGTVITTVGVILFLQNSFGWWESWAFAWTFIVIAVGAGLFLMGLWNQSEKPQRIGLMIAGIGVALLFLFGTFFGLGFSFLGFPFATRVIWPVILIGIGAFLVMRGIVVHSLNSSVTSEQVTTAEAPVSEMPEEPMPKVTA
jgi:hypothetical protein